MNWIQTRRKQLGLSQEDLATRLQLLNIDVGRGAISHWEQGRYPPRQDAKFVMAMAEALEMTSLSVLLNLGHELPSRGIAELSDYEREIIEALRQNDKIGAIKKIVDG